jgi:hypothetical protein
MDYSNSNAFVLSNSSTIGTNDRLVVTLAGYVGIGTTNPTQYSSLFPAQLAVNATSAVDGIFATTNNSSAAELVLFKKDPSNNFGSLLIQHSGSSGRAIEVNYGVNMGTGVGGTTSYFVNTNGSGYYAGNVGIGVTSPTAKLTVVKSTRSNTLGGSSVLQISDASATGQAVGDRAEINFYTNSDSLPGNLMHATIGIIKTSDIGNETADLYFGTSTIGGSPVERMRITSGGNVGIGTTSPAAKLSVVGTIAQTIGSATTTHFVGVTGSLTTNTVVASLDVSTQPAYGVFFDYVVYDDTEPPANARAGNIMTVNNNSTSRYTDTSTSDIGDTTPVDFSTSISGNNLLLTANIASGTWYVRLNYRRF